MKYHRHPFLCSVQLEVRLFGLHIFNSGRQLSACESLLAGCHEHYAFRLNCGLVELSYISTRQDHEKI